MTRRKSEYVAVGVAATATIATAVCLALSYGDWRYRPLEPEFFEKFDRWPWFRFSLLQSFVTFLVAHVCLFYPDRRLDVTTCSVMHGICGSPAVFLLAYPGNRPLGLIGGDPHLGYAMGCIAVVQGLACLILMTNAEPGTGGNR